MGQKQAAYDSNGTIISFYDTNDSPAPQGAVVIDITDDEWLFCISNQGAKIVKGGALVDAPPPDPSIALNAAKVYKKNVVKAYRDNLLALTPFEGKQIQSDLASKMQISTVADSGAMPDYAAYWRTADNSYLPMTLALFVQLKQAIMAREGAAFVNSGKLQDEIDALTDLATVNAFDITQGWPA